MKTFFRVLIFLIVGLVAYSFFTNSRTNWANKLNLLGAFGRSVQETQGTAMSKANQAMKQMNEKNRQLEKDLAELDPGSALSNTRTMTQVPAASIHPGTGTSTGASPPSSPPQASDVLAGKVKDAAQTINRNYREIERTDAILDLTSSTR